MNHKSVYGIKAIKASSMEIRKIVLVSFINNQRSNHITKVYI